MDMGNQAVQTLSQRLGLHVATTRFSAIPVEALRAAKLNILDTLAVAWAGSDAPGCQEALKVFVNEKGANESTAWAYGVDLPAPAAAFINGMSSAALDYDALGRESPVHVNVTVLPAAMAVAEKQRSSGKDFLAALILGSDVMCRMGAAASHPHRGWSYTSAFGGFGAAAATARLLKLDAMASAHALGMAFIQASGTQQANIEPSLTKRMLSAFGARAGVYAALLAEQGLTAPKEVFEGKFGLYKLYQDGDPNRLVGELGTRFESTNISLKKYPSCGCNHTSVEATLRLVEKYNLTPDDVVTIRAVVTPYINRIVGGLYDPSGDAQVAAQFNLRYSIACALVRRKLGLLDIEQTAARDPELLPHIAKITVEVDPSLTTERGPVVVEMVTKSQGMLSLRVEHVPGSTEAPLSESEVKAKFEECFRLGVRPLDSSQIAELIARINSIEHVPDMSKVFDGIC